MQFTSRGPSVRTTTVVVCTVDETAHREHPGAPKTNRRAEFRAIVARLPLSCTRSTSVYQLGMSAATILYIYLSQFSVPSVACRIAVFYVVRARKPNARYQRQKAVEPTNKTVSPLPHVCTISVPPPACHIPFPPHRTLARACREHSKNILQQRLGGSDRPPGNRN